ncbi:MAG TPA: hypothetical protein VFG83_17060, partial [Kofleriaceae bacterium]|nr:hypothetical protein [Kofleriaceae bacterium]
MTFRRLLWWGDLEAGRRRDARRGILGWPKWVYVALASALLFAEAGRRLGAFGGDADSGAASEVVLVVLALTGAIAALGAPFRMYWRHDAALLARLPLPGRALFGLA